MLRGVAEFRLHQPEQHMPRQSPTAIGDRPSQDLGSFAPRQHAPLKRAKQLQARFVVQGPDEIEGAMKSELITSRFGSLKGEAFGNRCRSEPQALIFQFSAAKPPDDHVLGVRSVERKLAASLQQAPRTKREATVADVMGIVEVGPDRADIIELEKVRVPSGPIEDESVPLNAKRVTRLDKGGEIPKHEP
ncbi:MAG TPA: hypothetical protein VFI67_10970 [Sphingomicrobium sp.]|nr:hypothetical protein [Sphingomicrobium sp.]